MVFSRVVGMYAVYDILASMVAQGKSRIMDIHFGN